MLNFSCKCHKEQFSDQIKKKVWMFTNKILVWHHITPLGASMTWQNTSWHHVWICKWALIWLKTVQVISLQEKWCRSRKRISFKEFAQKRAKVLFSRHSVFEGLFNFFSFFCCSTAYSRIFHAYEGNQYIMDGGNQYTPSKSSTFGELYWLSLPLLNRACASLYLLLTSMAAAVNFVQKP